MCSVTGETVEEEDTAICSNKEQNNTLHQESLHTIQSFSSQNPTQHQHLHCEITYYTFKQTQQ